MDIKTFTKIFGDKHFDDYTKMKYKYSEHFDELLDSVILNGSQIFFCGNDS